MPIHLRAEAGDYAPAVLCPGDPRRAQYVAETVLKDARLVNDERGMPGFTGTYDGRPLSVQTTGMGCPSAAIVFEELIQLGARRIIRIGTCGGLQPGMQFADLVVAIASTPQDQTVRSYTGGEDHAPTADWRLVESAVGFARELDMPFHVGPIVSSDVFYDPDGGRMARWASRGHLGVEMEAAVLFTVAALRQVQALCLLTVSDILYDGAPQRIADADLARGVDRMMDLAAHVAVAE
jgi:5'-methylthioadenosine phosphorylase/purine-nucleoside phosphorylase